VTFIAVQQTSAEPLQDAKSAYDRKDYSTALSLWLPLAEAGHAEAQRYVGILYENGFAVARDGRRAVEWFSKAAAQGDTEAEYRLGMRFVHGDDGLPQDVPQGLALMAKAGEQGNVRSFSAIGDLYRSGLHGVPKDLAQSVVWYRKAADLGYPLAQDSLGIAYRHGLGVRKDIEQAIFWLRKAADQDDALAEFILGEIYEDGDDVAVNKEAALCWYRRAGQERASQKDDPWKQFPLRAVARLEKQVSSGAGTGDCQ
jgi:TPR repeat protein